jgi:beta-lactamase regulating signal transducer with metallopeptidase domain/protein involved in polysaccharide export with SLBB domain
MTILLEIGLINAALVTVLALGVWLVTCFWRQPVFVHAMWVIVLVKLITPPMVTIPWPFTDQLNPYRESAEIVVDLAANRTEAPPLPPRSVESGERATLSTFDEPTVEATHAASPSQFVSMPIENQPPFEPQLSFYWAEVAAAIWLAGSAIFLAVTVARLLRFHRALTDAAPAPEELRELAEHVATRIGVSGGYRLRVTEGRLPPLVWPIGRPTIVLSRPLVAELSPEETQTLLAHEFAHLRRKDHWVRWLELVAVTIYWWHPVAWWARTMIRRSEEDACDAWVVWAFPDGVRRYASALITAVEFVSTSRPAAPLVASRLDAGGQLKERIENVMSGNCHRRLSWPIRLTILLLALFILPISLKHIHAQDEPPKPEKDVPQFFDAPVDKTPSDQASTQSSLPSSDLEAGAAHRIQPGMLIVIQVAGTSSDDPIADAFVVEPGGTVALGPEYGRVRLEGMTIAEAEAALTEHLKKTLEDPKVQVTMTDREPERRRLQVPADPYHIAPGDLLKVSVTGVQVEDPIGDTFLVEPGGTIALGPQYGRVKVAGITLEQAEQVTRDHFKDKFANPLVQITLGGWQQNGTTAAGPAESLRYYTWPIQTTPQRAIPTGGKAASEELEVLRQHVDFLEQRFNVIDAKFQSGGRGGEQDIRDMTGYELATARAALAQAAGDLDEAASQLDQAEKFAEGALQSVKAKFDAGRVTHDLLLKAADNLTESKRRLLRFRESQVATDSRPLRTLDDGSKSRRETAQTTPTSDSSLSIGVVTKLVEGRKQYYERVQSLAQKNLVSVDELEKAKNDYEAHVARLEQAKRALKYNELLVELAETEYQEALEKNLTSPNAVSKFEIRKLQLKVELAKAKLSELEE